MFSRTAHLYDAIYSFKDYAAEATRLHELIDERVAARTLLDVACGTGKHLAELREWYEVEGVDVDPALLALARERLPGVPLHEGDMTTLDLGREFDVVTCLFSSIGYVRTRERLGEAVARLAAHIAEGGLVVVEPWLTPESWIPDHVHAVYVDEQELKIARVNAGAPVGEEVAIDMHYLVGTPAGVEYIVEPHVLGLYTHDEYLDAFRAAGLEAEHEPEGLMGRGLYLGRRGA